MQTKNPEASTSSTSTFEIFRLPRDRRFFVAIRLFVKVRLILPLLVFLFSFSLILFFVCFVSSLLLFMFAFIFCLFDLHRYFVVIVIAALPHLFFCCFSVLILSWITRFSV